MAFCQKIFAFVLRYGVVRVRHLKMPTFSGTVIDCDACAVSVCIHRDPCRAVTVLLHNPTFFAHSCHVAVMTYSVCQNANQNYASKK